MFYVLMVSNGLSFLLLFNPSCLVQIAMSLISNLPPTRSKVFSRSLLLKLTFQLHVFLNFFYAKMEASVQTGVFSKETLYKYFSAD